MQPPGTHTERHSTRTEPSSRAAASDRSLRFGNTAKRPKTFFIDLDDERPTLVAEVRAVRRRLVWAMRRVLSLPTRSQRHVGPVRRSPAHARGQDSGAGMSAADLALIRCELRLLLDRHPSARKVLHHLAFLERALDHDAERLLAMLPIPLLRKALSQLEGLVSDWRPRGLADLRSRLATAIARRERQSQRDARS